MLQSMGLQRVGHEWVTELNIIIKTVYLTDLITIRNCYIVYHTLQSMPIKYISHVCCRFSRVQLFDAIDYSL